MEISDDPPPYSEACALSPLPPYSQEVTRSRAQADHPTVSNQNQSQSRRELSTRRNANRPGSSSQTSQQSRTEGWDLRIAGSSGQVVRLSSKPLFQSSKQQPGQILHMNTQLYQTPSQQNHATQNPQHIVMITQSVPSRSNPSTHLFVSILATIFCFFPTGIPAIIKACQSSSALKRGNVFLARSHAWCAKILSLVSLGIGLCIYMSFAIFFIVVFSLLPGTD